MNVYHGGDLHKGAVECNPSTLEVSLSPHCCISYEEQLNTTVVGTCPYRLSIKSVVLKLPKNLSELNVVEDIERMQLCGRCEDNYTFPVYSYNLGVAVNTWTLDSGLDWTGLDWTGILTTISY